MRTTMTTRTLRSTLAGLLGLLGLAAPARADVPRAPHPSDPQKGVPHVLVRLIGPDGQLQGPAEVPKIALPDAEWRKRLTPEQFAIARSKGTERPFCGGLLKEKRPGIFVCVCCDLPLFEMTAKFESGTGWPSFFKPIADENVVEAEDRSHGMLRTEILCARCDAHLGHVFDDGPRPTGRRHCVNSESLRFVPREDLPALGKAEAARAAGGTSSAVPPPAASPAPGGRAEIVLAGGCFWCVEAVFRQLDGVLEVVSGYAGGSAETANYKAVCGGDTGHAEAVKIVYDPARISLETLLRVHFATHDPTTKDRQGNDVGTQYRSAIFYRDEREKALAEAFIADLTDAKVFPRPIVTTLEPLAAFYPAEPYHQDYVACNRGNPYVRAVALPKVAKVREKFKELVKPEGAPAGGGR